MAVIVTLQNLFDLWYLLRYTCSSMCVVTGVYQVPPSTDNNAMIV